jgi:hypothetical protein
VGVHLAAEGFDVEGLHKSGREPLRGEFFATISIGCRHGALHESMAPPRVYTNK